MKQKIVSFHVDHENHWVADLQCGHQQHVRHDPPMIEREWVLTPEGRKSRLGMELECKRCDEFASVMAEAVFNACVNEVVQGFKMAGTDGTSDETRKDMILDRLGKLNLKELSLKAIRAATGEFGILRSPSN